MTIRIKETDSRFLSLNEDEKIAWVLKHHRIPASKINVTQEGDEIFIEIYVHSCLLEAFAAGRNSLGREVTGKGYFKANDQLTSFIMALPHKNILPFFIKCNGEYFIAIKPTFLLPDQFDVNGIVFTKEGRDKYSSNLASNGSRLTASLAPVFIAKMPSLKHFKLLKCEWTGWLDPTDELISKLEKHECIEIDAVD